MNTKEILQGIKNWTAGKLDTKVDKVTGKGLSTNDYTDADKQKVGNALVPADIAGKANTSDVYTKSETYTKTEVNGLVDTPHQEYVTVDVYSNLPATGSKDTIYRVSNYNGSTSQVDASVYSEYAWNGTQYIFLCVKSQIGEVFDVSVYNNNAKYANLAAALNGGANIPQSLRKGGMSVKFVQSSDNKYVQYRLMSDTFNTTETNWQGVDDTPTIESDNLVKSGGVAESVIIKNFELNKAIDISTGLEVDADGFLITEKIPVTPAHTILWNPGSSIFTGYGLCVYNSNDQKIDYFRLGSYDSRECTLRASAAYVIATFVKTTQNKKIVDTTDNKVLWEQTETSIIQEIEQIKEDIDELNANRLSKTTIDNKAVDVSNGNVVDANGFVVSEKIAVTPNHTLLWNGGTSIYSGYGLCVYNANNVKIDNFRFSSSEASRQCTMGASAAYIIATFVKTTVDKQIVDITDSNEVIWKEEVPVSELVEKLNKQVYDGFTEVNNEIDTINGETIDLKDIVYTKNYEANKIMGINGVASDDSDFIITDKIYVAGDVQLEWNKGTIEKYDYGVAIFNENDVCFNYARMVGEGSTRTFYTGASCKYIIASFPKNLDNKYVKFADNSAVLWQQYDSNVKQELDELKEEVEDLGINKLNFDIEGQVKGIGSSIEWTYNNVTQTNKPKHYFTLLHFSDIHGDEERMKRILDYANSHDVIDAVVFTGDAEFDSFNEQPVQGITLTTEKYFGQFNKPVLPIIGNHDVAKANTNYGTEWTHAVEANRLVYQYASTMGFVGVENKGYFYKDFATYGIRIIGIDEFETPRVWESGVIPYPLDRRYISQDQADWLCSTLNSTPSGYKIFILMHQPIDFLNMIDCEFTAKTHMDGSEYRYYQNNILQDILDAFIDKGTINKEYPSILTGWNIPTVTVEYDFSSAQAEFAAYLNGHTHADFIGTSHDSTQHQFNVNVNGAMISTPGGDLYRMENTRSQDSFNIMAIDTDNDCLRLIRVGANKTIDMRRRDMLQIKYDLNS